MVSKESLMGQHSCEIASEVCLVENAVSCEVMFSLTSLVLGVFQCQETLKWVTSCLTPTQGVSKGGLRSILILWPTRTRNSFTPNSQNKLFFFFK